MATQSEYAQLASRAYFATPENRTPIPTGWAELQWIDDQSDGFSAGVYQKGNEIVIAYTGTNGSKTADLGWAANVVSGGWSPQVADAMLLYMTVKRDNPGATITFTGHSLGGGLAAMMGIFFDRPASVFDAAPFELGARSPALAIYKASTLALGFSDAAFDSYWAAAPTVFAQREVNVTGTFLKGEFLEFIRSPLTEIGTSAPVDPGSPTGVSADNELHSMTLLASMMASNAFANAVRADPKLLASLFDSSLYARNTETFAEPDLLTKLYSAQVSASPTPLLDRFAADLGRIGAAGGTTALGSVHRALRIASLDYYAVNAPASATQLFTASGGGVHFKLSDIAAAAGSLKSPRELAGAVWSLAEEAGNVAETAARNAQAWHVQSGSTAMTWVDANGLNDAALGGTGADSLDGGAGQDLLLGLAGADNLRGDTGRDTLIGGLDVDWLNGGADDDMLMGGIGNDTYRFDTNWGSDIIEDSDGQGRLDVQGFSSGLPVGKKDTLEGVWRSDDRQVTYVLVEGTLTVSIAGAPNSITIRNWSITRSLGITLSDTPLTPLPAPPGTWNGDFIKQLSGSTYLISAGNYLSGGTQVGAADVVNGTEAGVLYNGFGGNDAVFAAGGDDVVDGGDGSDLLAGGTGADTIRGGAGADFLFGSGMGAVDLPTRSDFVFPVSPGTELARGFSWIAYTDAINDVAGFNGVGVVGAVLDSVIYETGGQVLGETTGNVIDGGSGNDFIAAGSGADVVHGGTEDDLIWGMGGRDALFGDAGNDRIAGDGMGPGFGLFTPVEWIGNDVISGGSGNDTLLGQGGDDHLLGGDDNDDLSGDDNLRDSDTGQRFTPLELHGSDYLDGGNGNDKLQGDGGDDRLYGGDGADQLIGDDDESRLPVQFHGDDYLDGQAGNDSLAGSGGDDRLIGGLGNDLLLGDNDQSVLAASAHGRDTLDGGDGADELYGGGNNDQLVGGTGNDTLLGDGWEFEVDGSSHGADFLDGGIGNDQLAGGGGSDTLLGGDGRDTLDGDDDPLHVGTQYHGNDLLDGGIDNDSLNGRNGNDTLLGGTGVDTLFGGDGNDHLVGGDGNDQLRGDAGNDALEGGIGADGVMGGAGNDTITSDDGDYMDGGEGDDVYNIALQASTMVNGQLVVVSPTVNDALGTNTLRVGAVSAADCHVFSQDGQIRLAVGALGVITLGTNTDLFSLGVEVAGGARVTLQAIVLQDDSAGKIREGVWTSTGVVWLNPPTEPQILNGGAGNDRLEGGLASDSLYGNGGHDTLVGSDSADYLSGGTGRDSLGGGNGNDFLEGGAGDDWIFGQAGSDTLHGDGSLIASIDHGSDYINGGDGNDILMGFGGNDTLIGGRNDDRLDGGTGTDTFVFGRGSGRDYVVYSDIARNEIDQLVMAEDVLPEDMLLTRQGDDLLIGIEGTSDELVIQAFFSGETTWLLDFAACATLFREIRFDDGTVWDLGDVKARTEFASAENDSLTTFEKNDRLYTTSLTLAGGGGDDVLYGRNGADQLDGGSGKDTLYGMESDDSLVGGLDWDQLNGGDGADTLDGGDGYALGQLSVDFLYGGSGNDTYVFRRGSGRDTIHDVPTVGTSFDVVQLGPDISVQDITLYRELTADGNLLVRINGTDDELTIQAQFRSVFAESERPIEQIRFADGTVWVMADIEARVSQTSDANDTVAAFTSNLTIDGGLGDDVLSGSVGTQVMHGGQGRDELLGSTGAELLFGGTGNDTLRGGAGIDTLEAGLGNDFMEGAAGADVYRFNRGDGRDLLIGDLFTGHAEDTLVFGAGILPADINVSRSGNHVAIGFSGSTDQLLLWAYFNYSTGLPQAFAAIRFADGTVWDSAAVLNRLALSTAPAGVAITGTSAGEALQGLGGNDTLSGADGMDTLDGGAGDDTLSGGTGIDSFLMNRGSGYDTIIDAEQSDEVRFGAGIAAGDLRFVRDGDDLVVAIAGTGDALRINGYCAVDPSRRVERLVLSGGAVMTPLQVSEQMLDQGEGVLRFASSGATNLLGTDGGDRMFGGAGQDTINAGRGSDHLDGGAAQDVLSGGAQNDTLFGGAGADQLGGDEGNDSLDGGDGDDSLTGGAGDDFLTGGAGNDTYFFGLGSGDDVIENADATPGSLDIVRIGAGISPDDVMVLPGDDWPTDVRLQVRDRAESLHLLGYFVNGSPSAGHVDQIIFADGTTWTAAEVRQRSLLATSSSDRLQGGSDSETIDGQEGSDELWGNGGDDTLRGMADADSLIGGGGNDLLDGGAQNDSLSGDDGNDRLIGGTGNDTLEAGAGADYLEGGAGNDWLSGDAGWNVTSFGRDTLDGGEGDDKLFGDGGDDLLLVGRGEGNDSVYGGNNQPGDWDVLSFKDGVTSDQVQVARVQDPLYSWSWWLELRIMGTEQAIRVYNFFDDTGAFTAQPAIREVKFADGTVWDAARVAARAVLPYLPGTSASETVIGTDADEFIEGFGGADTLLGAGGADWIEGGSGGDRMEGGAGDDTYTVDSSSDQTVEGAGSGLDSVLSSVTWTLASNIENLRLSGSSSINGTGNALNNVVVGNQGDNYLDGGAAADTLRGGMGNDTYRVDDVADVVEELAAAGTDTVTASVTWTLGSELENLVLVGTSAINGSGNSLDNYVTGNAASNVLSGGAGTDTLAGGLGDDLYLLESASDTVVEAVNAGVDTVQVGFTAVLAANVERLVLTGGSAINGTGNALDNSLQGNSGVNRLDGGLGADTSTGLGGNDTYVIDSSADVVVEVAGGGTDSVEATASYVLSAEVEKLTLLGTGAINGTGNASANTLVGNSAANRLDGGAGADSMSGGAGDDTYVVDATGDVVTELATAGTDTVESSITLTLGSNLESLVLTGAGAINGTGNSAANAIAGNTGANRLDGASGADTMAGGAGNDTYVVDNVGDVLIELMGNGTDAVESSITWTLGADFEKLTLTGTSNTNATGNTLANTLIGNAGANRLDGGAGVDSMTGGAGNDVYVVDIVGDTTVEAASGGTDTVEAAVTWTLSTEVENLTLTGTAALNATGNGLANTLRGNAGNNVLNGGTGIDTMIGGLGDDTYVVDSLSDVVTESASQGTDTVQTALSLTLAANVENLLLTGTSAINGTGNSSANTLIGNSGANRLDGGTGADTLTGAAGNDTYLIDNAADTVVELAGGGSDSAESSVSWTLAAEVEKLTLTGTSSINAIANALANTLVGNTGANRLDGGAGVDSMTGGAGNDVYVVDVAGDTAVEIASGGTDTVEASLTWTLGTELENLTLTGTAALNATGNALANTLRGNSGSNVLSGLAGNDSMLGGAGDDIYVVDVATDVVTENASEGTDLVQSAVTWTLGSNVENLILSGSGVINGTGNTLNNVLTGNSVNNTLTGGAGNDTLDGGAGNDTLLGGTGDDGYFVNVATDVVTENASEGTDTVNSAVTWTLGGNLENLTLTGATAANGTGNALANMLTGNTSANTLTGAEGNDTYVGGAGNDTLTDSSTTSADVYRWGIGAGNDSISDAGGADRIEIAAGVVSSQVTLTRSGNNLLVGITGASDVLTVLGWYTGTANKIEEIKLSDGTIIGAAAAPLSVVLPSPDVMAASASALVEAMAQFDPAAGGVTYWDRRASFEQPVLAGNAV